MTITTKSVAKAILLVLAILLLCALVIILWLRYEFSRVSDDSRNMSWWQQVVVQPLDQESAPAAPCRDYFPDKRAWFGATHVHTAASYDATAFGTTTTVNDAYAYARGEPIALRLRDDPADAQVPVQQISSPLDFMAVTDHAESLGEVRLCYLPGSDAYDALACRLYRGDIRLPAEDDMQAILRLASLAIFGQDRSARICGKDGSQCQSQAEQAWRENQLVTERWQDASEDCSFSTFHGYEYTLAEEASNLHRNILFRSATVPQAALSAKDARTPEQLWQALDETCITGHPDCDVLAIPHNSNWSSGRMWQPYSNRQLPHEKRISLSKLRQRVEPLAEILQVKGDSECRNNIASVLGPVDEFCDFEKLRAASEAIEDCGEAKGSGGMMLKGCTSRYNFVRYALTAGLKERRKLGVNPFEMGIIAATDSHNGTPSAGSEKEFLGAHGIDRGIVNRLQGSTEVPGDIGAGEPVRYNPGGIAGVYAHQNSRAALFDAMRSRETFGTSGPRIRPRLFAGWDLQGVSCDSPDLIGKAYKGGVPMGSVLPSPATDHEDSPIFLASASHDPRTGSGLLQRLQVVKGWVDEAGATHQRVFDIAGDSAGLASVDPQSCLVSGPGHKQLCSRWQDPEFDPDTAAVYYLRVLENPSCRWHYHDCLRLPAEERPASCSDPELPWQIQERAWTSPIWFYPK